MEKTTILATTTFGFEWHGQKLQAENEAIDVVEQRFVHDGHIWTSAGISAGMDMTLAYIAASAGEDTAGRVQRWAEYYPDARRHGDAGIHADMPAYVHG